MMAKFLIFSRILVLFFFNVFYLKLNTKRSWGWWESCTLCRYHIRAQSTDTFKCWSGDGARCMVKERPRVLQFIILKTSVEFKILKIILAETFNYHRGKEDHQSYFHPRGTRKDCAILCNSILLMLRCFKRWVNILTPNVARWKVSIFPNSL